MVDASDEEQVRNAIPAEGIAVEELKVFFLFFFGFRLIFY